MKFNTIEPAREMIDALRIKTSIKKSMLQAFKRRIELFGRDILFFSQPFIPISLTGTECSLECRHCNSYYLSHMLDGSKGLYSIACRLAEKGAKGILLSGGSVSDESMEMYIDTESIKKVKQSTKLKISAHTGIVKKASMFSDIDMALIDVIGDDKTIHDILGIDAKVKDYEASLKELSCAGIPFAPHIIVGLYYGKLKGEFKALEILRKFNPKVVVIVVFIPTKGTMLEGIAPPEVKDVVRIITKAREMFNIPISLSCVRPGGRYRSILDHYAILSGIDRIAVPSRNAYITSRELGLNIIEVENLCCTY